MPLDTIFRFLNFLTGHRYPLCRAQDWSANWLLLFSIYLAKKALGVTFQFFPAKCVKKLWVPTFALAMNKYLVE